MADLSSIAQLASPTARRLAIDSQIERNRQVADPVNLAQRETPRLSISELNALDIDQVRQRFVRSKADTRTPFVKFLDLVDLPRNAVANGIASFTAPQLYKTDDRAAAGLARINFSDFLSEMGVENRLVRGVVGFAGDVAMDPLTYLGGAGIGLQVAGKGGNVARIGLTGGRQLRRGIKATAKGGQAANPVVRELIQSVASPRLLAKGAERFGPERVQAALNSRLLGSPTTGQRLRDLALPPQAGSGLLSRSLDDVVANSTREAEQFAAAKRFVSEFGVGSNTRGIGPAGGTTVARIPFTDIGLRGPAFTRTAQTQQGIAALAGAGTVGASQAESIVRAAIDGAGVADDLNPLRNASQAARSVNAARQMAQRIKQAEDSIEARRSAGELIDELSDPAILDMGVMQTEFDDLVGTARQAAENSEAFINRFTPQQLADADPATIAAMGQRLRAQRAMVLKLDLERNQEFRNLQSVVRNRLVDSRWNQVGDEILELQNRLEAGEISHAEFLNGGEGFKGANDLMGEWDSAISRTGEALVNMGDTEAANALRLAEAAEANFTTSFNLANALDGSISAFLSSEQRVLAEVARQQLGLGQGALGASLFVPMRVASQGLIKNDGAQQSVIRTLDNLDRSKRRVFGQRGAEVSDMAGAMRFMNADGRDMLREQIAAGWKRNVAETLDGLGLKQSQYGRDATDLMQILAHMRLHGSEIEQGKRGLVHRFKAGTDDAMKLKAAADPYADDVMEAYTPMWRRYQEIKQGGFGGEDNFRQVAQALDGQIEQILDTLAQAGQASQAEGMLSSLLRGYVPKRLSGLAEQSARVQRSLPGYKGRNGSSAAQPVKAAFQKERSTDLFRFRVDEATAQKYGIRPGEHEFMDFERSVLGLDDVQLDAVANVLGPAQFKEIRDKAAVIRAFEDVASDVAPEVRREVYGIPADVFRLNDEFRNGKFSAFADPSEVGPYLFDTDFPSVVADRLVEQIGQESQRALRETVLRMGLQTKVNAEQFRRTGEMRFTNGMVGTPVQGRGNRQMVRVGQQNYRTLDQEIVGGNPMFATGLGGRASQVYLPEEAADAIEGAARVMSPDNANAVVKATDAITNAWKTTTLAHPSWTIANIVGGIWQAGQNNLDNVRAIGQHGPKILKAMMRRKNEQWLAENGIQLQGRGFVSYQNLMEDALRERVIGASRTSRIFVDAVKDGRYRPFPIQGGIRGYAAGLGAREDLLMSAETYARAAGRENAKKTFDWMRGAKDIYVSEKYLRRVAAPWYAANQSIEDTMRLATYVGGLERGLSPAQSGRMVREAMFDYGDLTDIESRVFKRMMPFYCVPDDSEILTRDGWKSCDDLTVGEEVLSFNNDTGAMEWTACLDKAIFDHDQELEVARSANRELRYTPNHRWVVETYDRSERKIIPAHDMNTGHRIVCAAELAEGGESLLTPEQARLYGWLVTDGYWRFRGNHCEAMIYQTPGKFLDDVIEVAGREPRPKAHPNGTRCCPVRRDLIEPIIDILRKGKDYSPSVATRLSKEAAQAMWDAILKADGSSPQSKSKCMFVACQIPRKKATIQILAALLGYRTTANGRGVYISKPGQRRAFKVASFDRTMEHYKGRVWCPKTKNGTWVMRQGKVVTISGNTWMRKSGAYQLRQLMDNPQVIALAPKLKANIEEALVGESAMPEHLRPGWLREQVAVQLSADPGKEFGILTGTINPTETAAQIGSGIFGAGKMLAGQDDAEGIMDLANYFGSSLAPWASVPLQIGAGREFFTDRKIGASDREGDLGVGEFVLGQVRPFREFGVGSARQGPLLRAAGEGPASLAGRAFLGGRAQSFAPDRLEYHKLRELQDAEDGLRRAINLHEREGHDTTQVRAELMQLYEQFIASGHEAEVPKWAKSQLVEIAQRPSGGQ